MSKSFSKLFDSSIEFLSKDSLPRTFLLKTFLNYMLMTISVKLSIFFLHLYAKGPLNKFLKNEILKREIKTKEEFNSITDIEFLIDVGQEMPKYYGISPRLISTAIFFFFFFSFFPFLKMGEGNIIIDNIHPNLIFGLSLASVFYNEKPTVLYFSSVFGPNGNSHTCNHIINCTIEENLLERVENAIGKLDKNFIYVDPRWDVPAPPPPVLWRVNPVNALFRV